MSNDVLDAFGEVPNVMNKGVYWELEKDPVEKARAAWAAFKNIESEQMTWRQHTLTHVRMYRNIEMMGYAGRAGTQPFYVEKVPLSLNVVRNMANAVHSRITRNQVKAQYQCKGADWAAQEKSKQLEAFGTGLALKGGLHKKSPYAFIDCLVTGTGVMKTYRRGKEIIFDRIFSPNLCVDFAEGSDVTLIPSHFYEVKYPSKAVLVARAKKAGKSEDEIDDIIKLPTARQGDGDTFYILQESDATDRVRVVECYYINPDDEFDGQMVTVGEGGVYIDSGVWKQGNPYSVMRWSTSNLGWYGMGLAEELKGIQAEINKLLRKIANAMNLLGNPYIFADRSANLQRGSLTDIPGSVILYSGKPPVVSAPQTVHPEMFQHLDRLYSRAYEIVGISQLAAHGQKPPGIESGRALLVFDDQQDSDRFANVHREWSNMHVEAITKGVRAAMGIPGYEVPIYGKSSYETLKAKDLDIGEDDWVIHPMPVSMLGDKPEGQIEMIDILAQRGLIGDQAEMLEEIATPDVLAYLDLHTSPNRLIRQIVGSMLAGGEYIPPEPALNLAKCMDIAQLMYLQAKLKKCPEENLAKIREWQVQVKGLLKKSAADSAPSIGATPNTAPGAPPMMPPPPPSAGAPPPASLTQ